MNRTLYPPAGCTPYRIHGAGIFIHISHENLSIHAGKYIRAPWIHMDPMVWIGLGVQLRSHPRPTTKNYQHNLFFWGGLCQKVKLPKNKLKETTDVAFRCRQVNLPRPMWCFAYMPGQDLQISFLGIRTWWVFADFFCGFCVPYWLGV